MSTLVPRPNPGNEETKGCSPDRDSSCVFGCHWYNNLESTGRACAGCHTQGTGFVGSAMAALAVEEDAARWEKGLQEGKQELLSFSLPCYRLRSNACFVRGGGSKGGSQRHPVRPALNVRTLDASLDSTKPRSSWVPRSGTEGAHGMMLDPAWHGMTYVDRQSCSSMVSRNGKEPGGAQIWGGEECGPQTDTAGWHRLHGCPCFPGPHPSQLSLSFGPQKSALH